VSRKRQNPKPAVIDACCLIDLLVSGHVAAILRSIGHTWHLPDAVRAEIQFIRQHDPARPGSFVSTQVDFSHHLNSGLLTVCQPPDTHEQSRFVQYAAQFRSDGEAMCLAIAESRSWSIATDDRKAVRVAQQAGLTVLSCPALIEAWADTTRPNATTIFQVLTDIQTLAQFRPNSTMPASAWWFKRLTSP
jgi:predicted nucleic acid-binding protein